MNSPHASALWTTDGTKQATPIKPAAAAARHAPVRQPSHTGNTTNTGTKVGFANTATPLATPHQTKARRVRASTAHHVASHNHAIVHSCTVEFRTRVVM